MVFTFLLPGNILSFLKSTPEAISQIVSQVYSPDAWIGVYSNFPEGYVDIPYSQFTESTDLVFIFDQADGNTLIGEVRGDSLCVAGNMWSQAILFATVRLGGNTADLELVEFLNSSKVLLATGVAKKNGIFLDVELNPVALSDPNKIMSQSLRLGLHPHENFSDDPNDDLSDVAGKIRPCDPTVQTLPK
ncbi:hypothetical protein [Pseudorhodobacter sp. MZDSW-24AT]|uniref:hypothetical protein n=1 Tax=Pseudorhodobacter sp. MZDSW-24AT TaxID=2052957 RepID=UPI0012FE6BA1|nr:hypothetical protein [Pseudorhodobacter sp. MZDSW-24AT]